MSDIGWAMDRLQHSANVRRSSWRGEETNSRPYLVLGVLGPIYGAPDEADKPTIWYVDNGQKSIYVASTADLLATDWEQAP